MWIFLNNAFLSIVDKGGDGSTLLVRARQEGDIERVFPKADVKETPRNDYRYRARLGREEVAQAVAESVRAIGYPNFKATVKEPDRHDAYLGVWEVMYHYQARRSSEKALDKEPSPRKGLAVNPVKLGKPEIIFQVLAEGGSLMLMSAEVLAWDDPERPAGGYEIEGGWPNPENAVKVWRQEVVFWAVRDERTLAAFLDEEDLPACSLFNKTEFREWFNDALHDFMDSYHWWLMYPGQIHPWWKEVLAEELEERFPGWQEEPHQYAKDWYSCHAWHERLVAAELP